MSEQYDTAGMAIEPKSSQVGDTKQDSASRLSAKDPVAPKDYKVWLFAILLRASQISGIRHVKALIGFLFVELAPSVPVSLRRSITGTAGHQAAILGGATTILFCLIVPLAWTFSIGRLSRGTANTVFLLQPKLSDSEAEATLSRG